ncbi:MAG: hypothetical protein WC781_02235 [Candidatus Pacearchaeota archaeon]|jgi:hypothetical protein
MISNASKIGFLVSLSGQTLDTILELTQKEIPYVSDYIGDWSYIAAYSGILPAIASRIVINEAEKRGCNNLVKIAEYFPKITTACATAYMFLGETLLPQILPGTPDIKDVPATLIAGIATYLGVDVITKFGRENNNSIKEVS